MSFSLRSALRLPGRLSRFHGLRFLAPEPVQAQGPRDKFRLLLCRLRDEDRCGIVINSGYHSHDGAEDLFPRTVDRTEVLSLLLHRLEDTSECSSDASPGASSANSYDAFGCGEEEGSGGEKGKIGIGLCKDKAQEQKPDAIDLPIWW